MRKIELLKLANCWCKRSSVTALFVDERVITFTLTVFFHARILASYVLPPFRVLDGKNGAVVRTKCAQRTWALDERIGGNTLSFVRTHPSNTELQGVPTDCNLYLVLDLDE